MNRNAMALVLLPATERAKRDGVSWFEVAAGRDSLVIARGPDGGEIARAEVKRVGERQGSVQLAAGDITAHYDIDVIGSGGELAIRVGSGGKSTTIGAAQADYPVGGVVFDPDQVSLIALWESVRDPLARLADDLASSAGSDSADWGIAPCGLTWLGVSIGVGACATGVLVSCAAALVAAGAFVEHCV